MIIPPCGNTVNQFDAGSKAVGYKKYATDSATGGRALIPKNAFGWPILAGLFFARVGSFSFPFSIF
jgi:hypothetical protein